MTPRTRVLLTAAGLCLATLIAYIPALRSGYIWDDDFHVTKNYALEDFDGLSDIWFDIKATPQYYPLVHTSFWFEYQLWGKRPAGYHVNNVLIHAINAFLVWRLLLCLKVPGALFAACVFALHPVHVESVAWITERKNTLSLMFYLLALRQYLKFSGTTEDDPPAQDRGFVYGWALAFFVAALLCKTVTASLPAAILLILWWKRGKLRLSDITPLIPFFIVGIALGLHTAHLEKANVGAYGREWEFTIANRILIAGRAVWFYLYKLLLPINLVFIYNRWPIDPGVWWRWLFPISAVALVIVLFAMRNRIGRGPVVAVLLFGGTLFPALGFVNVYPMRYSFTADHFQYHASVAMIVLVAALATMLLQRFGTASRIAAACLLVVFAGATWRQCYAYKNEQALWDHTVAHNPDAWMAWGNLASLRYMAGDAPGAVPLFEKSLSIYPDDPDTRGSLASTFLALGKMPEAMEQLDHGLKIAPDNPNCLAALGAAHLMKGDLDQGIETLKKAVERKPSHSLAQNNLGVALMQRGDFAGAVHHLTQAILYDAESPETHTALATALRATGRNKEALWHYEYALKLRPDYAPARQGIAEMNPPPTVAQ